MTVKDRACPVLVHARHRCSQRDVAAKRPHGRDQLTAACLELGHERGTGQPKLLVDRVARLGAGGGRDSEEAC